VDVAVSEQPLNDFRVCADTDQEGCQRMSQVVEAKPAGVVSRENSDLDRCWPDMISACMVMTEALAYLCGWDTKLEPRFQFDFLRGPAFGLELPQGRSKNCVCGRRKNIDRLRAKRGLSDAAS
jgi:hypothetical protein